MNINDLYILTSDIEEIEDICATNFHSYLRMFAVRVKRIYPKCSFGYVRLYNPARGKDGILHHLDEPSAEEAAAREENIIHVYHKDSPYTAGVAGYGNFRRSQGGDNTFTVFSRKIDNAKYTYGEQQNMRSSKNIDVAERHARAYLRDWEVLEVAEHHKRTLRQHWRNTVVGLEGKIRGQFDALTRDKHVLITELRALRAAGHTYINAKFGSEVDALLDVHDDRSEKERERSTDMTSVIVLPKGGDNFYHTVRCNDVSNSNAEWVGTHAPYDDNTLPDDIAGKLAVLSMCKPEQWVDNVGYKVDDKIFFVVNHNVS